MTAQPGRRVPFQMLSLDYPMSIGVFERYEQAQKAVDTLSDAGFPVQNVLIVGTELRQLERVTGRLNWGRVLLGGALSGLWLGLFVGLVFSLFDPAGSAVQLIVSTMAFGAVFGAVWAAIGYAFTRGQRDFTSVSQIVPGRFEILTEHKVAHDAREILRNAGITPDPRGWAPPGGAPQLPGAPPPGSGMPPAPPQPPDDPTRPA